MQVRVVSAGVDALPVELLKVSAVSMHDAFQSSYYGYRFQVWQQEEHCDLSLRQADCRCNNQDVSVLINVNFPGHRMNKKFT